MSRKLLILEPAKWDIQEYAEWYHKKDMLLSLNFEDCIDEGMRDIQLQPEGYQFRYRGRIRIRFIKRFPYGIHYTLDDDTITVIAVFHTKKDPKSWQERLDSI